MGKGRSSSHSKNRDGKKSKNKTPVPSSSPGRKLPIRPPLLSHSINNPNVPRRLNLEKYNNRNYTKLKSESSRQRRSHHHHHNNIYSNILNKNNSDIRYHTNCNKAGASMILDTILLDDGYKSRANTSHSKPSIKRRELPKTPITRETIRTPPSSSKYYDTVFEKLNDLNANYNEDDCDQEERGKKLVTLGDLISDIDSMTQDSFIASNHNCYHSNRAIRNRLLKKRNKETICSSSNSSSNDNKKNDDNENKVCLPLLKDNDEDQLCEYKQSCNSNSNEMKNDDNENKVCLPLFKDNDEDQLCAYKESCDTIQNDLPETIEKKKKVAKVLSGVQRAARQQSTKMKDQVEKLRKLLKSRLQRGGGATSPDMKYYSNMNDSGLYDVHGNMILDDYSLSSPIGTFYSLNDGVDK